MNVRQFIRVAKLYCRDGESVMDQFDDVLKWDMEEVNPNAVKCIKTMLESLAIYNVEGASELLDDVNTWLKENNHE